jgi:uncharacterized protein (DUF1501 family)
MAHEIDRRTFLSGAVGVGALAVTAHSPLRIASRETNPSPVTTIAPGSATSDQRILVLVTLYGGNDGLNTLVPYEDPAYYRLRGAIGVPPASVLQIGQGFGFHPAFTGIKSLYDQGNVAVVRGVGYPDPNYSHFVSMDTWQSADPSGSAATGWIGRWLDGTNAGPLDAMFFGANVPLVFVGEEKKASAVAATSSSSAQLPPGGVGLKSLYAMMASNHRGDDLLERESANQDAAMLVVSSAVSQALVEVGPPTKDFGSVAGSLGAQLQVVAQLIGAQFPTRVYGVTLGGFDAHAGEEASYAPLLAQLDAAVSGFFTSIAGLPDAANTVTAIYSEFGRQVAANASGGTDHGAANDVFVIGPSIKGGLYGDPPSLTNLDAVGSLIATSDFRSVYATLLDRVIDVEPTAVLGQSFGEIPFI